MSTNPRCYLDWNASAPLASAARTAIEAALVEAATWGNPSSIHAEGRRARDLVERARDRVAGLAGRPREHIVFTSGGSEANWLGVRALAALAERRGRPRVVATTRLEHPSLHAAIGSLAGWRVRYVMTANDLVADEPPSLVALAVVNHELGTTVDRSLISAGRAAGALIHLDGVQAAGKLALGGLDSDALALSAHKIGGPQGVGALVISEDSELPTTGHQERGRRGGTENVLGIVGFAAAAAAIDPADWPRVAALGERLEAAILQIADARIHGADRERVGGTINAGFRGARGESVVIGLDLAGIAASTGAACTSGSVQPSPVLLGLGLSADQAREGVRLSLGRGTTEHDIERTIDVLPAIVDRVRAARVT